MSDFVKYVRFSLLVVLPVLLLVSLGGYRGYAGIVFDRNCEGYLKRAADANTVELATAELATAVGYMEAHGLTEGYTSVVYTTPDEDVGFWYRNLRASLDELRAVSPDSTQLERSNLLMRLRETILDEDSASSVTCPTGISVFPHNKLLALIAVLLLLLAIPGGWFIFLRYGK